MKAILLIFLYGFFPQTTFGLDLFKNQHLKETGGNTKLHLAIIAETKPGASDQRLKKTVQALLQGGENPNVLNNKGESPLNLSAGNVLAGYNQTFKVLLQYGADPNIADSDDKTDFQKIIKRKGPYEFKLLFANSMFKWSQVKPNVNTVDKYGKSILNDYLDEFATLMTAMLSEIMVLGEEIGYSKLPPLWKQIDFLNELFLSRRHTLKLTTNMRALKYKERYYKQEYKAGKKLAFLLINKGVDLTHRNTKGELPLHQAVQLPNPEIAREIIKKGGIGYLTNKDRALLVRLAVEAGYSETIRLLQEENIFKNTAKLSQSNDLNHNQKAFSTDPNNNILVFMNSPIYFFLKNHLNRFKESASNLSLKEIVEIAFILIENMDPIYLTYRDAKGDFPLHQAIQLPDPQIAQRIIQVGGTRYLSSSDREILISHAVKRGHAGIITLLQQDPFDPLLEKKSSVRLIIDKCLKAFGNSSTYQ